MAQLQHQPSCSTPAQLERHYVHGPYSQLARHVSNGNSKPWPNVRQFILKQPVESLIADIGMGNGKYLSVTKRVYMVGSDICSELVEMREEQEQTYRNSLFLADSLSLPLRDGIFDAVISVAVIHHFATEGRRLKAVRELSRILKPGGRVMIYVWALEQTHREFTAQDVLVPWLGCPNNSGTAISKKEEEEGSDKKKVDYRDEENAKMSKIIEKSVKIDPIPDCPSTEPNPLQGSLASISKKLPRIFQTFTTERKSSHPAKEASNQGWFWQRRRAASLQPPVTEPPTSYSGKIVSGVAKFSPMLGRRLASALGTESIELIQITELATQLATEIIEEGIREFLQVKTSPDDVAATRPDDSETLYRYYHVFREGELQALVAQVDSLKIVTSYYDHANWCVVAEKIEPRVVV